MQKIKIDLAKETLFQLESKTWEKISLLNIIGNKKKVLIKDKNELLININRYFDYLLKKNLSLLEESSRKDMLFEVLMARFDILNIYRISVKKIIKYFLSNPHKAIKLLPSFIESIILMATLSNIEVNGIKGASKIKIIFGLYILVIYTWKEDETESLEKTMTSLDKYLNNLDKYFNII